MGYDGRSKLYQRLPVFLNTAYVALQIADDISFLDKYQRRNTVRRYSDVSHFSANVNSQRSNSATLVESIPIRKLYPGAKVKLPPRFSNLIDHIPRKACL